MAFTTKDLLLFHLDHTFEKESGQPSLAQAVVGLTSAQAAWKPSPARHSIWQITRHVAHWKEGFIAALDGHPLDYDRWNRRDWQEISGTQHEWERDVSHLHAISREVRARLDGLDEERLSQSIKWYAQSASPRPIATRFLQLATHDIYHSGQIQYLFALQEIPVEELAATASRDDVRRMERILASDASVVNSFSRDGWTALHVACYFGMTEAVRFLLSRGASATAVSHNAERQTPLHSTVGGIAHRAEIVRLLIGAGADPTARDASGKTPLEAARTRGEAAVVALLGGGRSPMDRGN